MEEEATDEVSDALTATALSVAAAGAFALGIAQIRGIESAVEFVSHCFRTSHHFARGTSHFTGRVIPLTGPAHLIC